MSQIPNINLKDEKQLAQVLQQYGEADFKNTVLKNFAKDYIMKEAALLSVVELTSILQPVDTLNVIQNTSPAGGVKVSYPIEAGVGNQGQVDAKDVVGTTISLRRANVSYKISHEVAAIGNADLTRSDSILEATEQLSAHMDFEYINALVDAKYTGNDISALSNKWSTSTGDPFDDINQAIGNIESNSSVKVNNLAASTYSLIAPIQAKSHLNKNRVIDGQHTTIGSQIESRLSTQIVYTRQPFVIGAELSPWPLATSCLLIPTKDRKVGKFYTFDGAGMPSLWETEDEDGKKTSQNTWMKYKVSPNEKDGTFADNRRIALISDIL